uniref:Uncharacterized protein n=1 Tax=Quercus lobata TaxID=97700 RepID=A0A7N2L7F7_QUELO
MNRQLCEPTLLSSRDHVFGRRNYVSRAQFLGTKHEIGNECSGGVLKVKVDGEIRLVVKRSREEIDEEELIGFIEFRFDAIGDMVVTVTVMFKCTVEKSRKQMKERKNRAKKIRGVKKQTKSSDAAKAKKK